MKDSEFWDDKQMRLALQLPWKSLQDTAQGGELRQSLVDSLNWESRETKAARIPRIEYQRGGKCTEREPRISAEGEVFLEYSKSTD